MKQIPPTPNPLPPLRPGETKYVPVEDLTPYCRAHGYTVVSAAWHPGDRTPTFYIEPVATLAPKGDAHRHPPPD